MDIAISPYQPQLGPDMVALWNDALGELFPMSERLWRQNVDDDPDYAPGDGLVARSADGRIAGMALTRVPRHLAANPDLAGLRGLGWVVALVVAPQHQGQGLGSRLLALAEDRLRHEGATRCDIGSALGHFLPGPPSAIPRALSFWERHGYQPRDEVYDLQRSLADFEAPPLPTVARREGYEFVAGQAGEEPAILAFLARVFPGRWRHATARAFAAGGSPADVILLKDRAGTIQGFLSSWRLESAQLGPGVYWYPAFGPTCGGIGPMGIAPEVRGHGLGLALVAAGAETLRQRGVDSCVIDWTHLVAFYERLGYRVWRGYRRCTTKTLT